MKPRSRNYWMRSFLWRFTAAAVVALLVLGSATDVLAQGHVVDLVINPIATGFDPLGAAPAGSYFIGTGESVGPLLGAEPPTVNNAILSPQSIGANVSPLGGTIRAFVGLDPNTGQVNRIQFLESGSNIDLNNALQVGSGTELSNLTPGIWQSRNTDQFDGSVDGGDNDLTGPDGVPNTADDTGALDHGGASENTGNRPGIYNADGTLDEDQIADAGDFNANLGFVWFNADGTRNALNAVGVETAGGFAAQEAVIGLDDPFDGSSVANRGGPAEMAWTLLSGTVDANLRDVALTFEGNANTANNNVVAGGAINGDANIKFTAGGNQIYSEALNTDSNTPTTTQFAAFQFDGTATQPTPANTALLNDPFSGLPFDDASGDGTLAQEPLRAIVAPGQPSYPGAIPWKTFLGWDSNDDGIADAAANPATDPLVFADNLGDTNGDGIDDSFRPAFAGFPQRNVGVTATYDTGDLSADGADSLDNPGFLAPIVSGNQIPADGLASYVGPDLSFEVQVVDMGFDGVVGGGDDTNLTGGFVTVTIPAADLADNNMVDDGMGGMQLASAGQAGDKLRDDFRNALNAAGLRDLGPGVSHLVDADRPDVDDDGPELDDFRISLTSDSEAFGIAIDLQNVSTELNTELGFGNGAVADPDFGDIDLQTTSNSHTHLGSAQPLIALVDGASEPRLTSQAQILNEDLGGATFIDTDAATSHADFELTLPFESSIGFVIGTFFFVGFTFDGEIEASFAGEYTPFPGDSSTEAQVAGTPALEGVGPEDYTTWANNFGLGSGTDQENGIYATQFEGDHSGNGSVGPEDYTLWANNFGLGSPPGPESVPEPSSLLLLVMGGFGLALARRWRKR